MVSVVGISQMTLLSLVQPPTVTVCQSVGGCTCSRLLTFLSQMLHHSPIVNLK